LIFYDCETPPISPAVPIPPIVCGAFAIDGGEIGLKHGQLEPNLRPYIEAMLRSQHIFAGHYIAFDMCAIIYQWPEFTQLVFEAYQTDRVTCTEVRQKLLDIADPTCEKRDSGVFYRKGGKLVRAKYSLEHCIMRHFGLTISGKGSTQLSYGELLDVPIGLWSEEARQYPKDDVSATRHLWYFQEQSKHLLKDQYRQSRKSFWLALMSAYGKRTNKQKVDDLERSKRAEVQSLQVGMLQNGLLRYKGPKKDPYRHLVKDEERVRELVEQCWDGEPPRTNPTKRYPQGRIKCDADTLKQIHDCPELNQYKRYKAAADFLSRDIPALRLGCEGNRVHTRFDSLKATGRTSSKNPNIQNFRRKGGVRECYEPSEWIWNPNTIQMDISKND